MAYRPRNSQRGLPGCEPEALLAALDFGAGAVAFHLHVPRPADEAGRDLDLRIVEVHAMQARAVGLAPDLAVVEGVTATDTESRELPLQTRLHRFSRATAQEAPILVIHLRLGRFRCFCGLADQRAVQPLVEVRQLRRIEPVKARCAELFGRHLLLDARGLLGPESRSRQYRDGEGERKKAARCADVGVHGLFLQSVGR